MVRTFPQFSYHFCPFYNASVLTERLRFAILKTVQMSGNHRHQRPLTSLEKQDSWLSGLLYHVIFFSDLYISYWSQNVNTFCQIGMLHPWSNLRLSLAKTTENAYTRIMKIYLGSDHRGFLLKEKVFAYLAKNGYNVEDVGGVELNPDDDFPQFAQAAALKVIGDDSKDPRAILICGGGQGMCMAANRFKGIRASVIWDAFEAKMTRNDNDSNVLCLPARILEDDEAAWKGIIETWLNTPYANAPRFNRRNAQLDELS